MDKDIKNFIENGISDVYYDEGYIQKEIQLYKNTICEWEFINGDEHRIEKKYSKDGVILCEENVIYAQPFGLSKYYHDGVLSSIVFIDSLNKEYTDISGEEGTIEEILSLEVEIKNDYKETLEKQKEEYNKLAEEKPHLAI